MVDCIYLSENRSFIIQASYNIPGMHANEVLNQVISIALCYSTILPFGKRAPISEGHSLTPLTCSKIQYLVVGRLRIGRTRVFIKIQNFIFTIYSIFLCGSYLNLNRRNSKIIFFYFTVKIGIGKWKLSRVLPRWYIILHFYQVQTINTSNSEAYKVANLISEYYIFLGIGPVNSSGKRS